MTSSNRSGGEFAPPVSFGFHQGSRCVHGRTREINAAININTYVEK